MSKKIEFLKDADLSARAKEIIRRGTQSASRHQDMFMYIPLHIKGVVATYPAAARTFDAINFKILRCLKELKAKANGIVGASGQLRSGRR